MNRDLKKLEVFDKPYWDGNQINSDATMKKTIEIVRFSENDLNFNIATIIFSTFYNDNSVITKQETPAQTNTDKAVNTIYQRANSMLQLSNKDLTRWVTSASSGIINIIISKASQNTQSKDIIPAFAAIESIEEQVRDVNNRLFNAYKAWTEMQNSHTQDEFNNAAKKWEILYEDDEFDKNATPKK